MNFLPASETRQATALETAPDRAGGAGPVLLALVAWMTTYVRAVMRGDDMNHLWQPWGSQIYLPNLQPGWIPNRVMDLYGRNLLERVFDATFFPAHMLTGVTFFQWYKIFSATLFTAFLLAVHRYVMAQLAPRPGALVSVAAALAILLIMPWTNQIRAVCYEVPGFLCYAVLTEFFAVLAGARRPAPWLLAAGFATAFSLEGYAAILLGAIAVALVLARPAPGRAVKFWRDEATVQGGLMAVFCAAALATTLAFSQRAGVSESFEPIREYLAYLHGGDPPDPDPVFYAQMLALGVAGLAAILLFRRRFAALCGWQGGVEPPQGWAVLGQGAGLFAVALCVTVVVAALISMETAMDFFSLAAYPWCGLLITAMLFGLTAAAAALAAADLPKLVDALRVFVLALAISRMAVAAIGQANLAYDQSERVQAAYTAALSGATGVVDTGLNLDATEMQQRELPTADSPAWFIDGYHAVLLKYYGVETTAVFR